MTTKLNIEDLISKYRKVKKCEYIQQHLGDLRLLRDEGVPFKAIAEEIERVTGQSISVTYLRNRVGIKNRKGAGDA